MGTVIFHTYVGSSHFFLGGGGVKSLNFNILGGGSRKMNILGGGMEILWIFWGGHHKIGLHFGVISCI